MKGDRHEGPVDRLSRRTGETLAWLFLVSAALTGWEVVSASLFRAPTIWVHDLTTMLCVACFLFGGAYAQVRREHIRITAIYDLLPARLQRACDVFGLLLALGYLLVLAWFTGSQAVESIRLGEMSGHAWNTPMPVVIRLCFFLATVLLALQLSVHLREAIRALRETLRP
ncbi:MAG: TRAP transporter small permease subunit [Geminicoccaceae bacterium]|nr:TRAP transporter small permease subunit [Geminicoccaceae bacterium]MDW8341455.1 TRAP transporter small permease subunit [Geminicoccaceae bacterium]